MSKRSHSKNRSGRIQAVVLATIMAIAGGVAFGAEPSTAQRPDFSVRTLVAEAEAALASGHAGRAVLDYERAQLTAPRSPAIAAGLARALATANLPTPTRDLPERAVRLVSADAWSWIGMAGLILGGMGLVGMTWSPRRRRRSFVLTLAGASVACLGILAAREVSPPPNRAVVVASDAVARIAPFATAEESFATPEGSTVSIEQTHDGYVLIATPEGRGWVPSGSVETILPTDAHRS
jgi:hypothetical protein